MFSEIYQGMVPACGNDAPLPDLQLTSRDSDWPRFTPPSHCYSKSASLTNCPVARFARQIAGQGYIVAAPSSYHEFTGPEALAYDGPGTDTGNEYKIKKVRAIARNIRYM